MNTAKFTVSKLFAAIAFTGVALLSVSPTVASARAGHDPEASCWISASPSSIKEGGSTTLTWGSNNADDAWIERLGDVSTAGSRVVYDIDEDTTFTLVVENDRGTASCKVDVEVKSHYNAPTGKAPGCTMWREDRQGGVLLRWNTTNATSANLTSVGNVSLFGQHAVYPKVDTNYTLTVYGNGQTKTCALEIERSNGTYYPPQGQYIQPYVHLTQIPYTGLDLGAFGATMYFLALALFAIAGAYLLAYYQGGVLRFSFVNEVKVAMRNQARSIRNVFKQ